MNKNLKNVEKLNKLAKKCSTEFKKNHGQTELSEQLDEISGELDVIYRKLLSISCRTVRTA